MLAQNKNNKAFVSLAALFFLMIFSVLSLSFISVTGVSKQTAVNHSNMNAAQVNAENGLQLFRYLVSNWTPPESCFTGKNYVTDSEARAAFSSFTQFINISLAASNLMDKGGIAYGTDSMYISDLQLDSTSSNYIDISCQLVLPLSESDYHKVEVTAVGSSDGVSRSVMMSYDLCKSSEVLEYAIASRGRIWLTGDSNIDGDVYSAWDNRTCSPFNMTSDTSVEGTINTVFTKDQVQFASWQLETLDINGDIVYDAFGNPVVSSNDEIQGSHEGINYGVGSDVPGMDITDYDTSDYESGLTNLPGTSNTRTEYFPHAAGDYTSASSSSSRRMTRRVYQNQHFTNIKIPYNYNAVFENCTFDEVLYVDCAKNSSSYYNNIRFDNCTFNGPIVTDTPSALKWRENCLYFTGSATFNNDSMEEATIMAPHFNVNLGNTVPNEGNENVLTGAIIGGIVDVRGNADIYGTIISMCDTTSWTSGYVTNIGVSLNDGGSESVEEGDIGIINIEPDKKNMLPSGITTPIVITPIGNSYVEL